MLKLYLTPKITYKWKIAIHVKGKEELNDVTVIASNVKEAIDLAIDTCSIEENDLILSIHIHKEANNAS